MPSCRVRRMSSAEASRRLSLCVMSRLAMHRAAGGQRHHLAGKRTADCLLEAKPHAADLLHEELAAARPHTCCATGRGRLSRPPGRTPERTRRRARPPRRKSPAVSRSAAGWRRPRGCGRDGRTRRKCVASANSAPASNSLRTSIGRPNVRDCPRLPCRVAQDHHLHGEGRRLLMPTCDTAASCRRWLVLKGGSLCFPGLGTRWEPDCRRQKWSRPFDGFQWWNTRCPQRVL